MRVVALWRSAYVDDEYSYMRCGSEEATQLHYGMRFNFHVKVTRGGHMTGLYMNRLGVTYFHNDTITSAR